MDKVSYALGLSIGNNFQNSGIKDLQVEDFVQGLNDVLTEAKPALSYDEAKQVINDYFMKLQQEKLEINKKAGEEFLSINKHKAGVVELPSGLQYEVLKNGTGAKPTANDKVKCHYHGTLINGQVFDSSVQRGEPAVFGVSQVIPGWVEALQLMPVGSKWRLFIPSNLAYGERGAGEAIEPNSTLIFDVELLDIERKMKKLSVLVATVIVAMGASFTSCGDSHKSASLKTSIDSASYAIGISTGAGYKENLKTLPGGEANVDDLIAGFIQAIKGDSSAMKMNPQQAQQYLQTYFVEAQAREAKKTKEEGDKFLAENKTKEGVITTESGLQYKVEKEGTGAKPTATDKVKVHYTGTLLDGTKFDSSVDRGEPAEFGVGQVIKGWTEGLQIMPVGSKYIFWIPAELAYGERGAGQDIKPNSVLKFEVELLDIVKE